MKISSYVYNGKKVTIINLFGKVFFITFPTTRTIKARITGLFLNVRDESDCDGSCVTYSDKLTDGKIYYATGWNYTRVGGSCGYKVNWFMF